MFSGTGPAAFLQLTANTKQAGSVTDVTTAAGLQAIANASGLRTDVVQFLENAAFYWNVNESALGVLAGYRMEGGSGGIGVGGSRENVGSLESVGGGGRESGVASTAVEGVQVEA